MPSTKKDSSSRRANLLLTLGAAAGLGAAAFGLLMPSDKEPAPLSENVVAVVNGDMILRDDYLRLLAGFERDSRNPVDADIRQHVLDRMIEEELLVQRALDLGLAQVDRRVRADLTSSLIASVVSAAEEHEPTQEELRAFYREQGDFFERPGRLRVGQILFRVGPDQADGPILEKAQTARKELLAGQPFESIEAKYGDPQISPLPDTLLPGMKLREYIGPSALKAVQQLEPGQISQPVRSGMGFHLLRVVDSTPATRPPFEEIEPQIRSEWLRRAGDQALRDYLDQLRADGDVQVLTPARS
ncbi:peptidylprolyl isomerase [Myxococcota bacterium]|nr:peptidylprolyl isomerase [Myxococcota bacterium]